MVTLRAMLGTGGPLSSFLALELRRDRKTDPRVSFLEAVIAMTASEETIKHSDMKKAILERKIKESIAIIKTLEEHKCSHISGKTWTTDAFYRETRGRIARRKEEGCLTVEMEAAALFAVAQFRGVAIGQILYGGDDISGIEWDAREHGQTISAREKIFWLAVEACLKL